MALARSPLTSLASKRRHASVAIPSSAQTVPSVFSTMARSWGVRALSPGRASQPSRSNWGPKIARTRSAKTVVLLLGERALDVAHGARERAPRRRLVLVTETGGDREELVRADLAREEQRPTVRQEHGAFDGVEFVHVVGEGR